MRKLLGAAALVLMMAPGLALAQAGDGHNSVEAARAQRDADKAAVDREAAATQNFNHWSDISKDMQRGGYGFGDSSCTCGPNVVAGN